MTQRTTLLIAAALTAFVVVLVGATALTLALRPTAVTQAETIAPVNNAPSVNDPAALARISATQAEQIAHNVVPNGTPLRTPELVSYQGIVAYEVILNQGTLYVDANSGKVLYNGATAVANNGNAQGLDRGEHHEQGEGHDD